MGVYNLSNTQKLDVIYNQNALIYGGVCLGIFTSYIISMQWRNEYKNNAINNVLVTPVKRESYCISKAIVSFIIIVTNIIMYSLIIWISRYLFAPEYNYIDSLIIKGMVYAIIACIPMIIVQHILNLIIKNTFITVGIGFIFSVTSILTVYLKIGSIIPYSYVLKFMLYGSYIDKIDILNIIMFGMYILLGEMALRKFIKKDII